MQIPDSKSQDAMQQYLFAVQSDFGMMGSTMALEVDVFEHKDVDFCLKRRCIAPFS